MTCDLVQTPILHLDDWLAYSEQINYHLCIFQNGRRGTGNHFEVKTYFCDAIAMKPHRNNPWDI
jgi:hypothetical protein